MRQGKFNLTKQISVVLAASLALTLFIHSAPAMPARAADNPDDDIVVAAVEDTNDGADEIENELPEDEAGGEIPEDEAGDEIPEDEAEDELPEDEAGDEIEEKAKEEPGREQSQITMITVFAELADDAANQTVPFGTALEDLALPDSLDATVSDGEDETETTFDGITWQSVPEYAATAGTYVFTPNLPDSYTRMKVNGVFWNKDCGRTNGTGSGSETGMTAKTSKAEMKTEVFTNELNIALNDANWGWSIASAENGGYPYIGLRTTLGGSVTINGTHDVGYTLTAITTSLYAQWTSLLIPSRSLK